MSVQRASLQLESVGLKVEGRVQIALNTLRFGELCDTTSTDLRIRRVEAIAMSVKLNVSTSSFRGYIGLLLLEIFYIMSTAILG